MKNTVNASHRRRVNSDISLALSGAFHLAGLSAVGIFQGTGGTRRGFEGAGL
jgi:hypothetical protein